MINRNNMNSKSSDFAIANPQKESNWKIAIRNVNGVFTFLIGTCLLVASHFPSQAQNVKKIIDTLPLLNSKENPGKIDYAPNRILLSFKPGIAPVYQSKQGVILFGIASIDYLNRKYHCTSANVLNLGRKQEPNKYSYTLEFQDSLNVPAVIKEYEATGKIQSIEPDYIVQLNTITPNDPYFGNQWSLYNNGFFFGLSTLNADIKMKQAWDLETGSSSVVVAVIDGGTKIDHPELAGRIWQNTGEIPGNGIDDDHNGYIDDINGWDFVDHSNDVTGAINHGTFIAGIICANGNNGAGMTGIDWHCKLMTLKIFNASGGGATSDIINAITYAANNGAKVINMSFGGGGMSYFMQVAIDYAYSLNVTLVGASGNSNFGYVFYPAAANHVIAVGSTNAYDRRSSYSNYGTALSVVAPGEGMYSLDYLSNTTYHFGSGTSFSAPVVVGIAALLLAQDPTRTPDEIKYIIESTADDMVGYSGEDVAGWDPYHGLMALT